MACSIGLLTQRYVLLFWALEIGHMQAPLSQAGALHAVRFLTPCNLKGTRLAKTNMRVSKWRISFALRKRPVGGDADTGLLGALQLISMCPANSC